MANREVIGVSGFLLILVCKAVIKIKFIEAL